MESPCRLSKLPMSKDQNVDKNKTRLRYSVQGLHQVEKDKNKAKQAGIWAPEELKLPECRNRIPR